MRRFLNGHKNLAFGGHRAFSIGGSLGRTIEIPTTHSNKKARDIYLVSNSLLYAIDDVALQRAFKPPIVVLVPMWLEKAHTDFMNNEWGQTPLGLPHVPRTLFRTLFPNHPSDHYLKWRQVIALRNKQIEFLKRSDSQGKIILHDLRNEDIGAYEKNQLFEFELNCGKYIFKKSSGNVVFDLPIDELGIVYNFLTLPRQLSLAKNPTALLKTRPHTELYFNSEENAPKSLLISGTGLSSVWIKKHFPSVKDLYILSEDKSIGLPQIPSNVGVNYDSIHLIGVDDLAMSYSGNHIAILDLKKNLIAELDPKTSYFTAIGYEPYWQLTKSIPRSNKVTLQDISGDWTAPKNIPKGSLTHRLMLFYVRSEIYDDLNQAFEMQFYVDNVTPMHLQKRLNENDILLRDDFHDQLKNKIQRLDNPLDEATEIEMYVNIFKIQKPSASELNIFKSVVMAMQAEINDRKLRDLTEPDRPSFKLST